MENEQLTIRDILKNVIERIELETWQLHVAMQDAALEGDEQLAELIDDDFSLMVDTQNSIIEAMQNIDRYLKNNGK